MEAVYARNFNIITMETYDGKKLYLKAGIGNSCEQAFNKNEVIWFETYTEAENFARQYFKNFNNYKIEDFIEYMQEVIV